MSDNEPAFVTVDLTEMMNAGVLMVANERFFWPLGLALTWEVTTTPVDRLNWCTRQEVHEEHDVKPYADRVDYHCFGTKVGDKVRNLHLRQWQFEDGHREAIELDPSDEIGNARRQAFSEWLFNRIQLFPIVDEQVAVAELFDPYLKPQR